MGREKHSKLRGIHRFSWIFTTSGDICSQFNDSPQTSEWPNQRMDTELALAKSFMKALIFMGLVISN
jgi:hypothetical protein